MGCLVKKISSIMGKRKASEDIANVSLEFSPTDEGKKKKSKKRKSLAIEEQADPIISNDVNGNETPKEKKKKKRQSDVEMPMTPDQCNGDAEETPKKKKKKNKLIEENGILTPGETPDTPVSEKSKKKKRKSMVEEAPEAPTAGCMLNGDTPKGKKRI